MANNTSTLQVVINGNTTALIESVTEANRVLQEFADTGKVTSNEAATAIYESTNEEVGALQKLANEGKITADDFRAAGVKIQEAAKETGAVVNESSNEMQGAQRKTREANSEMGSSFLSTAGGVASGLAVFSALNKVLQIGTDAVKAGSAAYIDYNKQIGAINAGLKATNGASKQTTDGLLALAESQRKSTGISTSSTLAVEAQLLNFKNITGDMFPKVVKQVEDAAAAMDHGVPSAGRLASVAQMLGKAYERPNNIQQALGRSLGDLSQEQINAVKQHYNLTAAVGSSSGAIDRMNQIVKRGAQSVAIDQASITKRTEALAKAQQNLATAQSADYIDATYKSAAVAKAQAQVATATENLNSSQMRLGNSQTNTADKIANAQAKVGKASKYNNDLAGAQALIYADLAGLVGGRAAEATDTLAGKQAMLTSQFQDLAIVVGTNLMNAWNAFYPRLLDFGNWIIQHKEVIMGIAGAIGGLLVMAFVALAPAIGTATLAFGTAVLAAAPFLLIGAAVGVLAYEIITHWKEVSKFFEDLFGAIAKTVGDGLSWLMNNWVYALGFLLSFVYLFPIKIPLLIIGAFLEVINWLMHVNWGNALVSLAFAAADVAVAIWNAISGAWNKVMGLDWGKILLNIGKGLANAIIDLINGAIKGAFAGVPVLGDHVPQIPHFFTGVENFAGGLAMVGEQGPELVSLPRGSTVYPAAQTQQALNSQSSMPPISLNVYVGNFMGSAADKQQLAVQLWQQLQRIALQHGFAGDLPNIGVLPI